jgi:hypothetical protein
MRRKIILPFAIGLVFLIALYKILDWREAIKLFDPNISIHSILMFAFLAATIVWMYGLRWNWLLGGVLRVKTYMVASTLCMGGNMFLPARGGDLLRVHYSHWAGRVTHAAALSRLLIEKIIDLITVAIVGVLAIFLLDSIGGTEKKYFLGTALVGFALIVGAITLVKFGNMLILRLFHLLFNRSERIKRNLTYLIQDICQNLTFAVTFKPGLLTIVMWLAVYVPSYVLIAHMVGVNLTYPEAMFVLFAAALGLMIPAAPSGVGTFHASVVSAFLLLGRSAAEGLLVGTAIHLFFLVIYATPAVFLFGVWFFKREALR